jgi:hypothetical protein
MWVSIAVVIASLFFVSAKVPSLIKVETIAEWGKFKQFSLGLLITLGFTGIIMLCIDFINAIVCVMYLAMIWALSDFAFWLIEKLAHITFAHYTAGWVALAISVVALSIGWYLDHNVWQTDYKLTTNKDLPDLKVAMFADSHIGTTFDDKGFAKHLETIQAQNPGIVLIAGDYVDDGTTREQMINATGTLGQMKTKYGIYYVSGNHDKGYYGAVHRGFSEDDLFNELKKNGINILQDESILVDNSFYVIGRKDYSVQHEQGGHRNSIEELTKDLDKSKYIIVLDHQPVEYNKEADAKVDLVLSGHTHGGQLFPFNQVGKWIKANDMIYGYERRKDTDFIVTSGISDWAIKFKTGTKSEFVIIDIRKEY